MPQSRRDFLKFMGRTSVTIGASTLLFSELALALKDTTSVKPPFAPLKPTYIDKLVLAEGFSARLLIKYNDPINETEFFGANNDFLAFTAFPGKTDEGVLWVNNEAMKPLFIHLNDGPRGRDEIIKEQQAVGGSLIHLRAENGHWKFVANSKYNRRVSGRTIIPFQKGFKIMGSTTAFGTLGNCAGGYTPWKTVLSCEENYDTFYGDVSYENKKRVFIENPTYKWYEQFPLPPEHYGWVVEINPFTGSATKLNSLGRFEHEGAKVQMSRKGFPVVYMGQDRPGGFIYKFISSQKSSLDKGTLYVADTSKGRWIPLDIKKTKVLKKHFNTQQDVLTYAVHAATVAGGTPQDRPEDIEIDPVSGSIFVSLTNNYNKDNFFGSLFKITEKNNDYESLEFTSETWLTGGLEKGFACPDNLVFDNKGNLWMTVDMDDKGLSNGIYKGLGNNGLFYIPLKGENAGKAFQVASAPKDAELTGPLFSDDYKTLFFSVQHPGENSHSLTELTSHWPDGGNSVPKSAVVAITGPALDRLTQL